MKNLLIFVSAIVLFVFVFTGFFSEWEGNTGNDQLVGSWTTGANMPVFAYHGASFSYTRNDTGWVYVVGGDITGGGVTTIQNYRYNVNTNTWTLMQPFPTPPGIWYTSGARIGNNGYIVAGLNGNTLASVTAQCTKYDIIADLWTVMAPMPAYRAQNKVVGYQDSLLYSAGGFDSTGTYKPDVFLYNQNSNSWRAATPLPAGRGGGGFALNGDTLVYVNGCTGAFSTTTVLTTYVGVISQSNRAVITWTTKANYPGTSRFRPDAMNWGCRGIIYSGGASAPAYTPAVSECYTYSPGADLWTVQPPMITGRGAHMTGSVSLSNFRWKFVNVCGYNGANVLTTDIYTDSLCGDLPRYFYCRNFLNKPIPDNDPTGVSDTIVLSFGPQCAILDLNIFINSIIHPRDSDLTITLRRGTTTIPLIQNRGGNGSNFTGTILNDSASIPISGGSSPFTGSFRPESPIYVVNISSPSGQWILKVSDNSSGATGVLQSWCLKFLLTGFCNGVIEPNSIPNEYVLYQNYPNPFNPSTKIRFEIPSVGAQYIEPVHLIIYDILGREVVTLINERKDAGTYEVIWDASKYSSGIYFYTLESGDFKETKKMLMLK